MDVIHVWQGDKYWSIGIPIHDPKVKVTTLIMFMLKFYIKFLQCPFFAKPLIDYGMVIGTCPKFYAVTSSPHYMTVRSRSQT